MSSKNNNLSKGSEQDLPTIKDFHIGVVISDWNEDITYSLRDGCLEILKKFGATDESIHLVHVPGAYELPMGARIILSSERVDAVICIGCVIKGETQHDEYINNAVAQGIMNLGLTSGKPVVFGVLTPNDHQQALDRAGGKYGNKGVEAATTAIKMIHLAKQSKEPKSKIGFGL